MALPKRLHHPCWLSRLIAQLNEELQLSYLADQNGLYRSYPHKERDLLVKRCVFRRHWFELRYDQQDKKQIAAVVPYASLQIVQENCVKKHMQQPGKGLTYSLERYLAREQFHF
jgi:hypothetical protein